LEWRHEGRCTHLIDGIENSCFRQVDIRNAKVAKLRIDQRLDDSTPTFLLKKSLISKQHIAGATRIRPHLFQEAVYGKKAAA
jgi:hypothetical protein